MFTDLPDEEQGRAAAILESSVTHTVRAGTVLAAAIFQDATFLFVEEGVALVETLPSSPSRAVAVTLAGPGTPLLSPASTERLRALTDVELTAITPHSLNRLLRIPRVATVLFERLAEQLRESHDSVSLVGAVHHVERVRAKLRHLARSHGRVLAEGGVRLELPLTHDVLAHMVGSSRGTVTRALDGTRIRRFPPTRRTLARAERPARRSGLIRPSSARDRVSHPRPADVEIAP